MVVLPGVEPGSRTYKVLALPLSYRTMQINGLWGEEMDLNRHEPGPQPGALTVKLPPPYRFLARHFLR